MGFMEQVVINRRLLKETLEVASEFKIVCVTGPRQAGKTTLCKKAFPEKPYINLENPDVLLFAMQEPRKFLTQFSNGAILDEVQNVPSLFSYLQEIVDSKGTSNQFILSGSNNFLMQENISQSLAGRVGYVELMPFSLKELEDSPIEIRMHQRMLEGFYPDVATGKNSHKRWHENYIKTYVERDVRQIRNIGNIFLFHKFLKICAGRAGQLINYSSIAKDIGLDVKTIDSWLSVLESSYIIFRLQPLHPNFNKRVIKSPKLYFYDTGVLCSLLGISTIEDLKNSSYYGAIFENFIITEAQKNRKNKDNFGEMFFFRDSIGNEVDLVIESGNNFLPIEIKVAKKFSKEQIKNLKWFQKTFRQDGGILIYTGKEEQSLENELEVLSWEVISNL
jgi:predicted AAA+ superfamily ATPase